MPDPPLVVQPGGDEVRDHGDEEGVMELHAGPIPETFRNVTGGLCADASADNRM